MKGNGGEMIELWVFFAFFRVFPSMKKMLRYLVIRAADGLGLGDGLVDGI